MINGDMLMQFLIVQYLIIAGVHAYEGAWPVVAYWISASCINGSILWMKAAARHVA